GRVRVALEPSGERGTARLTVEDSGIGIPPEALSQIFKMFHQEEGSAARRGLGIGLALVDSLVRMHGGRGWAESGGSGGGSRFTVELPMVAPGEAMPSRPEPSADGAEGIRPAVLLVEDSADSRETLAETLELFGYRVSVAASAEEAYVVLAS